MKIFLRLTFTASLFVSSVQAQADFPGNPLVGPKKYTTRSVGGGVDSGASVESGSQGDPQVRYVTYIVLFENRFWTNAVAKPLHAKLIAFEDLVIETSNGATEPKMAAPPAHPTVLRDGKVRLLVNKKPVEVALSSLSVADQEFVGQIRDALAKQAGKL